MPENNLNANLHESFGNLDNNKNIMLSFDKSDNSVVNFISEKNKFHNNLKSSGGLSAGAIVAIIIPCVAALIALAAIIFLVSRKPALPQQNQLSSNSMVLASSSNTIK